MIKTNSDVDAVLLPWRSVDEMNSFSSNNLEIRQPLFEKGGALWCFAASGISEYVNELWAMRPSETKTMFNEREVHHLRVLCRKIRTDLRNYRILLNQEEYQQFNRMFRKFSQRFAVIRDLDVLSKELENLSKFDEVSLNKEKLALILEQIKREREQVILAISPKVSKFFEKKRLQALMLLFNAQSSTILESDLDETERNYLLLKVQETIDQICLFRVDENKTEFHRLRIVLKHLRYSLDEISSIHPALFQALIKNLIPFQNQMGRIHDLEVWGEIIESFVPASGSQIEADRLNEVVNAIKSRWEAEEKIQHQLFISRWQGLKDCGFWNVMEQSLDAVLRSK